MPTGWLPLEANPAVLTKYIHKLGVSKEWQLADVVGLEPELLAWLPQPVRALILLFPCTEKYEEHREKQHEHLMANPVKIPDELFFMRQFTKNACGTIALIHSLANNKDIEMDDGILKSFLDRTKDLSPEDRGKALENDKSFTESHELLAREGQTVPDPQEKVYHHFVAFVNCEGILYELDGRKSFPINHGKTSEATFSEDAASVCKEFMNLDPKELCFNVLALVAEK